MHQMNNPINNPSGSPGKPALITVTPPILPRPIIASTVPIRPAPVLIRPANMIPGTSSPRSVVLIRPSIRTFGPQSGGTRIINITQQQQLQPCVTSIKSDNNIILQSQQLHPHSLQQYQCQQQQQQLLQHHQIPPQYDTDLDASNLDASNAPVATLLRNAPISMRTDSMRDNATRPVIKKVFPGQATSPKPSQPTHSQANRKVILERQIRVCNRNDRRFSVLRSNSYDNVDLSGSVSSNETSSKGTVPQEVFLQRENNLKQYRATNSLLEGPSRGAGSEYGSEAKEEARLKRLGVVRQGYQPENQPWVITVGKGRTSKRYKGVREGTAEAANVRYFIFCQNEDGNFDAYPVNDWYKVTPEVNYRYLKDEEAEAEYQRRNKTMNLFNVMMKRKLNDETTEEGIAEAKDGTSRIKTGLAFGSGDGGRMDAKSKSKFADKKSFLLTELDEWEGLSDDDDDEEDEDDNAEDGEGKEGRVDANGGTEADDENENVKKKGSSTKNTRKKQRQAAIVARKRRGTKKRARRRKHPNNSSEEEDDLNEEAWDESEPDDREGDEVDYITDSSSDEEKLSADEREQIYKETGVDEETGLKGLLQDMSDSDEQDNESMHDGADDQDVESDDEESSTHAAAAGSSSGGAVSSSNHRKRDRHSRRRQKDASRKSKSEETSSSSDSSASSSEFSSSSSSSSSSDSDAAPDDPAHLARKAQKRAELLAKISDKVSASKTAEVTSVPKKREAEDNLPAPAGSSMVVCQSPSISGLAAKRPKLATPADDVLTAAVRKYLIRKPITVVELLKKIKIKKLVTKNDDAETMLANALKQLRPLKQIINGQSVLSLKR